MIEWEDELKENDLCYLDIKLNQEFRKRFNNYISVHRKLAAG